MKKCKIYSLGIILILSIQNNSIGQEIKLLKTAHFPNYPSASAVAFYNNRLYVVGDDARTMLITDTYHKITDSIILFPGKSKQINKDEKADIESSFLFSKSNKTYLVALSSFSTKKRDKYMFFDLARKNKGPKIKIQTDFSIPGIKDLNIEGSAWMNKYLIMSNRANLTNQTNYLLIADFHLTHGIMQNKIKVVPVNLSEEQGALGISGLTYLAKTDMLLFTASTEKTLNSYDDGEIGDSYIGMVMNVSTKIASKSISADRLINLSNLLGNGPLQKIESVAVELNTDEYLIIHLAADNDNGESTLFKIQIKK